jgi:hypothetical protein
MFATILYYMVGLADRESAANFFVYLSLLFVFALLMNQQLAVFASFASAGGLNAYGACIVLLLILFCGFIVVPDTIPMYYSWIYWWNRKFMVRVDGVETLPQSNCIFPFIAFSLCLGVQGPHCKRVLQWTVGKCRPSPRQCWICRV